MLGGVRVGLGGSSVLYAGGCGVCNVMRWGVVRCIVCTVKRGARIDYGIVSWACGVV